MEVGQDYVGVTIVFLCFDAQGRLLLNKRSTKCRDEHGRWDCGGGALEFGVRVEDQLRKEIKEEYCANVLSFEFLGYRELHRMLLGKPTHWISLDYRVLVDEKQVRNGEPKKFDEIGWFNVDNLPDPLHSQFPIIQKKYPHIFQKS